MPEFKVGDLVEELDNPGGDKWPRSRALVIRICDQNEYPDFPTRQVVEVQWVGTGGTSLQFNGNLRIVKQ